MTAKKVVYSQLSINVDESASDFGTFTPSSKPRSSSVPERHPARTLRGHLETVLQSQEVDDDLSMAILATAASDPQLLDPLRGELSDDIGRILSDTQDPQGAMVVFWAIQGVRFQKLLKLPDGGADLRGRVIERLRTLIDELE